MTGLEFSILLGLNFLLSTCKGKIISPGDGTKLTFPPGSSRNITWTFDDSTAASRTWSFTSSDGVGELLASIVSDFDPQVRKSVLSGFNIIKPATLALSNVDQNYNGTYEFVLKVDGKSDQKSAVILFIAIKPTVTTCSNPVTVVEGNDLTCECQGQGGNPPANVTWSKDDIQIGETGKEEQTLTRRNVGAADSGTYKCVAESYPDAKFKDEGSIKVVVKLKSKPNKPVFMLPDKATAFLGESYTMTCESDGVPEPTYKIFRNDTEVVSTIKTYTIPVVQYRAAGTYKCVATNSLGFNSTSANLKVTGVQPTTLPSTIPITTTTKCHQRDDAPSDDTSSGTEWYIVVAILLSGIVIGILFSYMVWCSRRRWLRNRKPERNPEAQATEADTTYQELDLTKMNTEDNYQSLRVNAANNDAAANDDDAAYSPYTQLSKTRDVENNYQSLS